MTLVVFTNGVLMIGMGGLLALVALAFPQTRGAFTEACVAVTLLGSFIALSAHRDEVGPVRRAQTFLLTASIWITGAGVGALPLWLWQMSPTDAFFESMSGITTTGSTVLSGLDATPPGILIWRAILQWLGGIGFIVAGIAFLPILQVGGMQLFQTESSERGEKEMASATRFAGATVLVYLGLTLVCAATYNAGGMTAFEAVVHAMTTVSTGGYSTSDASFGHFQSPFLQWAGTFFMMFSALPFAWYIRALGRGRVQSEQVRWLLTFFAVTIVVLTLWQVATAHAPVFESLRLVAFNVVSVVTTTGYATTDYTLWGPFPIAAFFALTAIGGCTGSTAGGAKTMRWIIFFRTLKAQLRTVVSPNAVTVTRYEGRVVAPDVMQGVMAFFMFYGLTVALLAIGLGLFDLDMDTSISGALTSVANVGPGVGKIIGPAGNFESLPEGAKWLLCLGMYAGRLELFTVYVLFTRAFWRDMA